MANLVPEGLTADVFYQAVAEMRAVVGKQWVFAEDEAALRSYRAAYGATPDDAHLPSAAVAPDGVDQIQAILKIANDYRVPLWTISTGRNFAYGGPAPRKAGYVVLDLKRMNRIIEVNEELAYALVEPGVSYFQLYEHLQKTGSKLWIDPAAPGWGGPLGNTLDHGGGYTPYGAHMLMQCGMEVVLADGTVVRTGQGALPNSDNWQTVPYNFGPYVDGLFTQSNYGVVTKMGLWLMPEPPGFKPFMVTFPKQDQLHDLVEILRPFKLNLIPHNGAIMADLIWEASTKATRRQYYSGKGPIPPSARKKIAEDHQIGEWNLYAAFYGPEALNRLQWEPLEAALRTIPGIDIYYEGDRKGDPTWDYRRDLMRGIPNMTEFSLMNWIGGGGHINFSPICTPYGVEAMKAWAMIRDRANEFGFDYIGEFAIGWRELIQVLMLMFDRTDASQRDAAYNLFNTLIEDFAKEGYGEYRTHLDFMDQVAQTYDWNDHALLNLQQRLKDGLDPNGILSPGKQGIWPAHMREPG